MSREVTRREIAVLDTESRAYRREADKFRIYGDITSKIMVRRKAFTMDVKMDKVSWKLQSTTSPTGLLSGDGKYGYVYLGWIVAF